jgi:hypothetical protein
MKSCFTVYTSIYRFIPVYTGTYQNNDFHPGGQDSRWTVAARSGRRAAGAQAGTGGTPRLTIRRSDHASHSWAGVRPAGSAREAAGGPGGPHPGPGRSRTEPQARTRTVRVREAAATARGRPGPSGHWCVSDSDSNPRVPPAVLLSTMRDKYSMI